MRRRDRVTAMHPGRHTAGTVCPGFVTVVYKEMEVSTTVVSGPP